MLKKLAVAGTALLLQAGQAGAFTNRPETLPDNIDLECSPYQSTERGVDRDPAYKVNVSIAMNDSTITDYNVVYTLRSGRTIDRSDQYQLNEMHRMPNKFEWYWSGNRDSLTMAGETWKNNMGWWYGERLYNPSRGGSPEYAASFMCHQITGD
jgi:hypothetical protein